MVPFIISQWVTKYWWAGIFSLILVFSLWSLQFIAIELEQPFGRDPNDIDGARMQLDFNAHIRQLLHPETLRTPGLKGVNSAQQDATQVLDLVCMLTQRIVGPTEDCLTSLNGIW